MAFINHNNNPKKKKTTDCVTRAITEATGKPYNTVLDEQVALSKETGYFVNDPKLEKIFLERNGFTLHSFGRIKAGEKRPTVADIARLTSGKNPKHSVILACVAHHLTCCRNGNIYDIWDCSDRPVYKFYYKD